MGTEKMTIGQLAAAAGVSVETVRYYQRRGLIRRPHRPASGYRTYADTDVATLHFIKRAQALGFVLDEIKDLLDLRRGRTKPCHDVGCRAAAKLQVIQEKQSQLRHIERQLKDLARHCRDEAAAPPHCPMVQRLWPSD